MTSQTHLQIQGGIHTHTLPAAKNAQTANGRGGSGRPPECGKRQAEPLVQVPASQKRHGRKEVEEEEVEEKEEEEEEDVEEVGYALRISGAASKSR